MAVIFFLNFVNSCSGFSRCPRQWFFFNNHVSF